MNIIIVLFNMIWMHRNNLIASEYCIYCSIEHARLLKWKHSLLPSFKCVDIRIINVLLFEPNDLCTDQYVPRSQILTKWTLIYCSKDVLLIWLNCVATILRQSMSVADVCITISCIIFLVTLFSENRPFVWDTNVSNHSKAYHICVRDYTCIQHIIVIYAAYYVFILLY